MGGRRIKTKKTGNGSEDASECGFVHLRVHSAFSLLEGALPIEKLIELSAADSAPALAITDTNNLFGALEFSEKLAAAGIQPIVGCSLAIAFQRGGEAKAASARLNGRPSGAAPGPDGVVALLAQNESGYANLMALSSKLFLDGAELAAPFIGFEDLAAHSDGLIMLTGGFDGPIDRVIADGNVDLARKRLGQLDGVFGGRFYVELQRHGRPGEAERESDLVSLAYDMDLPLVATNEAYFPAKDDHEAHDALICIAEGRYVAEDDRRRLAPGHYLKSAGEMRTIFADLPEAIENTVEIARRCSYRPLTRDPILPRFGAEDGLDGESTDQTDNESLALKEQATEGLKRRLKIRGVAKGFEEKDYFERLDYELEIIIGMEYPGYFLIVADFIKWAKAQGIPVGPGRGSGAGSVIAWALTITDLDPIRYNLLFERFLNPERVSMPDFDIDFCQERRDEVIRYVQQKYGEDRVAQIITFGKLQARIVCRDVGRVLQMPYGQVDRLCKLIPNNPASPVTLAQAIEDEPKLREARDNEQGVAELLAIAQKLEGLYRHASTHAAGVVIGDRPLTELVPLYRDPRSTLPVTQFNMKWVEQAGLVKFDFLGLKTLTVITHTVELLARRGIDIDIEQVPMDDVSTYEMMARGDTVGIFQFESSGMKDLLRQAEPTRFEDLIALVALYRPGPMDDIPKYLACKHGQEEPVELHELVRPIVADTYGVIVYQEQVMQIAQVLSGYSLGEADILRKAMGKKIKSVMDEQSSRFVDGAVENGVDRARAEFIFEIIAKFASYGFNKAHSAAYALVAYQTAYLKSNHPVEFLAAIMTLDQGSTEKIDQFYQDARKLDIELRPPSINSSFAGFMPEEGGIRYSLAALKNIGAQAIESLCREREKNGPFGDLGDFASRIDARSINKRALENLTAAGAFDELNDDRALVSGNVEGILAMANRCASDRESGQNDLFGGETASPRLDLKPSKPWLPLERLGHEAEAVGFYLSGHPLDEYQSIVDNLGLPNHAEFAARVRNGATAGKIAGLVVSRQERMSQKGNRYAFASFSDRTGQFETIIFAETLALARDVLEPGNPVLLSVEGEMKDDEVRLRLLSAEMLDKAATAGKSAIQVSINDAAPLAEIAKTLGQDGQGRLNLVLDIQDMGCEIAFDVPGRIDVTPRQAGELKLLAGVTETRLL